MKIRWEEKDIKPGYRVRVEQDHEVCIIGYDLQQEEHEKHLLVSLLDGMLVRQGMTRIELAEFLTENDYLPDELTGREEFS